MRDYRGRRACGAGEGDTQELADRAVPAVACDEITAANIADRDAVGILLDCRDFVSAKHRYAVTDDALFEEILEPCLRHADGVRVAGSPWPAVQLDRKSGEMPAEFAAGPRTIEQRLEQSTQIEHLGRAWLQPTRSGEWTTRALLLEHDDWYPGQRELIGQHQAGRAGSHHDHFGSHEIPTYIRSSILVRIRSLADQRACGSWMTEKRSATNDAASANGMSHNALLKTSTSTSP
ncbi:MAG: hypothetical protein QOK12_3062 [Mycobacterium sp.]|nr:hypothetical protein [Mycobacterium sp.]